MVGKAETRSEPVSQQNAVMDREHGVQVALIDALCRAIDAGAAQQEVAGILGQLLDYSRAHFMSEELLMRLDSYEGFDEHVEDHARMLEGLERIVDAHASGDAVRVAGDARSVLAFLERHIGTKDAQYAASPRA